MVNPHLASPAQPAIEPHQLSALLEPPTDRQQLEYVVQHFNYVLPQLAATSIAPNAESITSSSSFTLLPSSSTLEAYLDQLKARQQQASSNTAELESKLRQQLLSSLSTVKLLKQNLSSLPDDIASTEDELLDLCQDLVLNPASTSASSTSTSSNTASSSEKSIMSTLESLQDAIQHLHKAKQYFLVLSQAEQLRLQLVDQDQSETTRQQALETLSDLDRLVSKAENIADSNPSKQPKLVAFLRAQRKAAFKSLKQARTSRLSNALSNCGWSVLPKSTTSSKQYPNIDQDRSLQNPAAASPNDLNFVNDGLVKRSWAELCQLQDTAERIGLVPRATSKPFIAKHRSKSAESAPSTEATAGSDAYQPLFASQILVEPLLLRFRYHFDGDRPTNRLDKPEWYLTHIASLIQSQSGLFSPALHGQPGSGGPVARLNRSYANSLSPKDPNHRAYRYIDTDAELLHCLLTPLRRKLHSSVPLLLDNPSLLAHTVFQVLTFDQELQEDKFPQSVAVLQGRGTYKISDDILNNHQWFNKWLEGEKEFAVRRVEEIMDSPSAWAISFTDSFADDDDETIPDSQQNTDVDADGNNRRRTTKSSRSIIDILDAVTERYKPLPQLNQKLAFLAIVQLPILRTYSTRLTKSLHAFESLSSAFARVMPGEIVASATGVHTTSVNHDSDMVKGLRGLGRLMKALLSAKYVVEELEKWSETTFFIDLSDQLQNTEEGKMLALGLRKDEEKEVDRELDGASLGALLRRGLKRGANVARPLAHRSTAVAPGPNQGAEPSLPSTVGTPKLSDVGKQQLLNEFGTFGVWEEPIRKFQAIAARAQEAVQRLVCSEVNDQLRGYILRRWDTEDEGTDDRDNMRSTEDEQEEEEGGIVEKEPIPTPSLIPALSVFSTHLTHILKVFDGSERRDIVLALYRGISSWVCTQLMEKVIMAGGSQRFTLSGGQRFQNDLRDGWLAVVLECHRQTGGGGTAGGGGRLGRNPEKIWKPVLDAATLLSLPSGSTNHNNSGNNKWNISKVTQVTFDYLDSITTSTTMTGSQEKETLEAKKYNEMLTDLGIDPTRVNVRDVLRRRVEVWK